MITAGILNSALFNRVFLSVFISLAIVFPIMMISKMKSAWMNPKKRKEKQEKAKQKAIAKGHVVEAKYKKTRFAALREDSDSAAGMNTLIFTYSYKGIRYTYWIHEDITDNLLNTLGYNPTLYFLYYPWRAATEGHIDTSRMSWPIMWIILAIIIFLIGK